MTNQRVPDVGEKDQIRTALDQAVARSSLRKVAHELGMSPTGLKGVLEGTDPYTKTWVKLRGWHAEKHGPGRAALVLDVLREMVAAFPEVDQPATLRKLLDEIEEIHIRARVETPGWMASVRAQLHE